MMLTEYEKLESYRIDRDWTWDELAHDMAEKGCQIPARTLHYLLKRAKRTARPLERTLHKLRQYLEATEPERAAAHAVAPDLLARRRPRHREHMARGARRRVRVS